MASRRKETGIWKAPNGLWGVDYRTPDGGRHKYIVGPKELAINELRTRQKEIYEGRYRPKPPVRMTFAELVKANLESKRGHISEFSYASDLQRLTEISRTLGHHLVDQITPMMCDGLLTKLLASGLKGSTCNRYRMAMSSAFNYAVRMELIAKNPVKGIPQYKEPDGRTRILAADEEPALVEAVRRLYPEREGELILYLHTGLRKGGMFNLLWKDVNLVEREITVHSKGTTYTVQLNDPAVAALRDLHARSGGRSKVTESRGYNRSMDWFKHCVREAGIEDFRPHDLRHTFGTRAIRAGVDLSHLQELMGHKSILTTRKRYVHLSREDKLAAVQKLAANTTQVMDKRKDKSELAVSQVVELKSVIK